MQLRVENLAKSFGVQEIFKDVSFFIDKGDKVGLIGANGMGKSTLVKCLLGELEPDAGQISFTSGLTVGYVEQAAQCPTGNLWQVLLTAQERILFLRAEMARLEEQVAKSPPTEQPEYIQAYERAVHEYEHLAGYEYESLVKKVAYGLGFSDVDFTKEVEEFSGGQKTRINLALALIRQPELLILDEPTNHLDIQMIEWLEEYLRAYNGGLLLISHDRYFLDKVTTKIMLLQNTKLQTYRGNFSAYSQQYELQLLSQQAAYAKQQEHIQETEEYIRRYKAGIKCKQARGRQSQLNRLVRVEKPDNLKNIKLQLPAAAMCAERVLLLENVSIGYDAPLLEKVELLLRRGEKVALIGANGAGKTTLLKSIMGELAVLQGRISLGNRVQVAYFSQEHEDLNLTNSLLEELMQMGVSTEGEARNYLASILFTGDDVYKSIASLSGGERARLVLLKLMLQGANFLVLDEPTNHLDVLARQVLEETLRTFDGSMLVVSHDRYFLDEMVERIWEIENGKLQDYQGNYSAYKEQKQKNIEQQTSTKSVAPQTSKELVYTDGDLLKKSKSPVKRNKSPYELEKRLEKVELSIREQEALLMVLERKMALPENHIDLEQSLQLATEHENLKTLLAQLLAEWEDIMLQLE